MHLGNRLRRLRLHLNISRKDIAHAVLSYSHYSNVEQGRYIPDDEILSILAERLNIEKAYLIYHNSEDATLGDMLNSLEASLTEFNTKKGKEIYHSIIQSYPIIYSSVQETWFYLLESYYLIRNKNIKDAIETYLNKVSPMLHGIDFNKLPLSFQKALYFVEGTYYFTIRDYVQARKAFIKKIEIVNSNKLLAATYYNLALICSNLHNKTNAVSYAKQSLKLHFEEGNWPQITETQLLLASIYLDANDLEKAKDYLFKGLAILEQHKLSDLKEKYLHNIGVIYKRNNMPDNALFYLLQSLELKKNKNLDAMITYYSIADIYIKQNKIETTNDLINEARDYIKEEKDTYRILEIESKLIYSQGKFKEYEDIIEKVINYYYEQRYWKDLEHVIEEYGDYLSSTRRYKLASFYYKKGLEIHKNMKGGDKY